MRSASPTAVSRALRRLVSHAPLRAALVVLAASFAQDASAAYVPLWVAKGDVPLPSWVKSARVLRADEPILASPSKSGKKRGAAGREARLPVFGARVGPGCPGRYI